MTELLGKAPNPPNRSTVRSETAGEPFGVRVKALGEREAPRASS